MTLHGSIDYQSQRPKVGYLYPEYLDPYSPAALSDEK